MIEDVAFVTAVVVKVSKEFTIDHERVYAIGISNRGFMSRRLAIERSNIFAAAGVVIATMGDPLRKRFMPEHAVSMLFMNGTRDPLVPCEGGEVAVELLPRIAKRRRK